MLSPSGLVAWRRFASARVWFRAAAGFSPLGVNRPNYGPSVPIGHAAVLFTTLMYDHIVTEALLGLGGPTSKQSRFRQDCAP